MPDVLQVPSSAADSVDIQPEQTTNATLLIRNMFECVAPSMSRALCCSIRTILHYLSTHLPTFIAAIANRIIERVRALGEGVVDRCGFGCADVPHDSLDTQPVICVWCATRRIEFPGTGQSSSKLSSALRQAK
eukprot:COSAG02_NODE_4358_length_5457_cov_2.064390_2_plen_133_part_00